MFLKNPAEIMMTEEDDAAFDCAIKWYICAEKLGDDKVRDHPCHIPGKYRGAVHNTCKLNYQKYLTICVAMMVI